MSGRPGTAKKVKLENGSSAPAPITPQLPPPGPYQFMRPPPGATWAPMAIDPALGGGAPPQLPPGFSFQPYIPPPGSQPPHFAPGPYYHPHPIPAPPQPRPAPVPSTSSGGGGGGGGGGGDLHDVSTLNDSLASAGVDLRAEEENLTKAQAGHHRTWAAPPSDRTKRSSPAVVDTRLLSSTLHTVARHHGLTKGASDDAVQYVAHALRARMQALIGAMLDAARHRQEARVDGHVGVWEGGGAEESVGMWDHQLRRDVALQLAALEKAEREEELRVRKERRERLEAAAAQLAALTAPPSGADGDGEDGEDEPKRKKKKEGPGVAARNMSEDVRKKMSNAVASHAVGLGKRYAWMTDSTSSASTTAAATKDTAKETPQKSSTTPKADTPAPTPGPGPSTPSAGGGWTKAYVSTKAQGSAAGGAGGSAGAGTQDERRLTMRDAMFVVQHERGHGGGRGAARGWT